jgi:hypothetical protein
MCVSRKVLREGVTDVVQNHPRVGGGRGVLGRKHANRTNDVRRHEESDRVWCVCWTRERKVFFTLHRSQLHATEAQSLSPKTRLSPWNFFFFPVLPYETDRPVTSPIGAVAVEIWLDCRV